ncbi:MAG: hypothetical protein AAGU15_03610 [Anaerolineaceae bacterium]
MQRDNSPQPFSYYLPAIVILIALGGGGLYYTLNHLLPTVGPRWLFYFCLLLLGAGLFIPLAWFLNLRFPSNPPAGPHIVIRQAVWFGVFAALLAWLQIGRVLTLPLAVIMGAAIFLIEFLIRMWERSRWKPDQAA